MPNYHIRVSALPFLDAASLVAHLASFGERIALRGSGAPEGGLSYGELAGRVAEYVERLGPVRRLVLLEGGNDVDSLVAYLGAHAAGSPVLLTGPGAARDALVAAYDPDVVIAGGELTERRDHAATELHPDLALLLSTSGTTGSPKLVRLSRRNVVSNARAIAEYLAITPTDVAATTLPMYYCYGLSVLHSHVLAGASLWLTDASVTDDSFWAGVRANGVTSFAGVPHTFDLLDRTGFAERDLPSLRYVTQAGGRMAPETVRRYAELGRERGFDLVVMYGATEATARMAWLPPLLAAEAPATIGVPIPGGSFTIEPLPERPIAGPDEPEVGELVYRGDNVMLGYATSPADLALGRTVHELRTGDVAHQREDGLFEIVGRRSRFAKVYGLRIDLDRVEGLLRTRGYVAAAADAGDSLLVAVASGAAAVPTGEVLAIVREEFGLPPAGVRLVTPTEIPRLPSGKVDYPSLAGLVLPVPRVGSTGSPSWRSRPFRNQVDEPREPSRGTTSDNSANHARQLGAVGLVAELLGRPDASEGDSFVSLDGDSLSYVEASLRLEELLGHLPADWPTRPLGTLTATDERAKGRSVETSVLLRALAIIGIVGSHANLFTMLGGAHILLGVLGFNFGRFHAPLPIAERTRKVARSVARIAVPSVLVIGLFSIWTEGLGWPQVFLINGLAGPQGWAEPQWHYWFIEAAITLTILGAALLAVPAIDRLVRARPFWAPFGLAVIGLVPRYLCRDASGAHDHVWWLTWLPDGDFIHRGHALIWLFAIGWAAARATTLTHRVVLSGLVLAAVPGFFYQEPARDVVVIVGLLALVWVSRIRLPELVARTAGLLASASLWIYLVHWQVYPHLEFRAPLAATLLSLAAGVIAWRAWERSRVSRLI